MAKSAGFVVSEDESSIELVGEDRCVTLPLLTKPKLESLQGELQSQLDLLKRAAARALWEGANFYSYASGTAGGDANEFNNGYLFYLPEGRVLAVEHYHRLDPVRNVVDVIHVYRSRRDFLREWAASKPQINEAKPIISLYIHP